MTKEDIEKRLEEFLQAIKMKNDVEIQALCEEFSMRKMVKRIPSQYGFRNVNNPNHHWDSINLKEYNCNKPILLCLSGNGTDNLSDANGFCKQTEGLLELLFKDISKSSNPEDYIDVFGCVYGQDRKYLFYPKEDEFKELYPDRSKYISDFPQAINDICKPHDLSVADAEAVVNNILMPRCLDENGARLSLDESCRNMSQVTFYTYCYGAKALNLIIDSLDKSLLLHGFQKKEVDKILSSMFNVSFARYDYTRKIPTVSCYAVTDRSIGSMHKLIDYMSKYNIPVKGRLAKSGQPTLGQELYPASFQESKNAECLEFAYWGVNPDADEAIDDPDHYASNMARDKSWGIENKDVKIYDAMSQILAWALSRAIENGLQNAKSDKYIPKIPMEELQAELVSIYDSFNKEELMTKE